MVGGQEEEKEAGIRNKGVSRKRRKKMCGEENAG